MFELIERIDRYMNKIEEYVEKSFIDIPDSDQKEQLKQDILQNLREKVYDLMQQGKSQEDAENKAIVDFGDMDDIKKELGFDYKAGFMPHLRDKKTVLNVL